MSFPLKCTDVSAPQRHKGLFYFLITVESLSVTIKNDTCVEVDTVLLFSLPNIHVFSPQ